MAPSSWSHHWHFFLLSGKFSRLFTQKNIRFLLEYQEIPSRGSSRAEDDSLIITVKFNDKQRSDCYLYDDFTELWLVSFTFVALEPWGTSHVDDQASTGPVDLDNENSVVTVTTKGWTWLLSRRPGPHPRRYEWASRQTARTGSYGQDTYWRIFAFSETRPTVFCLAPALPLTFTPTHHKPSYPCGRLRTA